MWGVTFPGLSGIISGQVNYAANLQQTAEAGCEYSRFASNHFSVLKDITPPVLIISYPADNAVVKIEDRITGTATDVYQLGTIGRYSFLGGLPGHDDGGILFYDRDDFRNASWELPVSDYGQCEDTLQEITLKAYDAVGNETEVKRSIYVDCFAPLVTIDEPAVGGWTDPAQPVIKGHASDNIAIDKLWLTIKDEVGNRYWNGTEWVAGVALIYVPGVSDKKIAAWEYNGLTKDDLRSGNFTIRAHVKDKVGRISSVEAASPYKKRYYLGKKDFTVFDINVVTVVNDGRGTVPNSFTTLPLENSIFIESQIIPARVAPYLNGKVKWTVQGLNTPSGTPSEPVWGNPSRFKLAIPPVPAMPFGREEPMGYRVFARVEQESGSLGSPGRSINQDTIDKCRQEYVDMRKTGEFGRIVFKTDPSDYNTGNCGAYIMLPGTVTQFETLTGAVSFGLEIGSAYRNPVKNRSVGGASESPHLYGRGIDVNPAGRPGNCVAASPAAKTEYARRMQSLYSAAPSPNLLENGAVILIPTDTADNNEDGVWDVFDVCLGGADHVHVGSGTY